MSAAAALEAQLTLVPHQLRVCLQPPSEHLKQSHMRCRHAARSQGSLPILDSPFSKLLHQRTLSQPTHPTRRPRWE